MAIVFKPMLMILFSFLIITSTSAQTCNNYTFSNNKTFTSCNDLPVLNSYLHWNYAGGSIGTVDIAYRHTNITTTSRWIAWAINPTSIGMLGAQALVAFQESDGTMRVYTSAVTSYGTDLQEGELSFNVSGLSGSFSNNEMIIFATLELPNNGSTTVNQVWQEGPLSKGKIAPRIHGLVGPHLQSFGTLNFSNRAQDRRCFDRENFCYSISVFFKK